MTTSTRQPIQLVEQPVHRDVLRTPVVGRFLKWKHSRTAVQTVLFVLAIIMIVDGLLGSPLAAKNTATVGAWVHYRGLIVVALLLAGNLFCAGCPFLLPRTLARRLGQPMLRWPRALRNKWLAIVALLAILFLYELYDLWSSPWLTAWVIVAYFVAAFVLEAIFTRDSFCMYVCPLGSFNFLYSTTSPLQITNREQDVCRDCEGHECINGRYDADDRLVQQGCQLELYVPTIRSNLDCTFCLDCVKACPYDNVALTTRPRGAELLRQTWPRRLDLALLAILAATAGLVNAFAMTPPVYDLEQWLARVLGTQQEAIVLGLVFLAGVVVLPLAAVYGAAWINRLTVDDKNTGSFTRQIVRYAYGFVPLGFGIWTAHYLFHLLIGPLTIVPALQNFFVEVSGMPLIGEPNWQIAGVAVLPLPVIRLIQVGAMVAGVGAAWFVTWRSAERAQPDAGYAVAEAAPWWFVILLLGAAALYVFLLPMEMRGNVLG